MPYGDKKSYSFFKMKYQGNHSAFPFMSPVAPAMSVAAVQSGLGRIGPMDIKKDVVNPRKNMPL